MVNIINSLGAGSGIDTSSLVSQLVEAERAPQESRLDSRQEKLDTQISAYGTLKSALSEFQSILTPLSSNDTFNARSVAFPDTDVITPNSLDAGAQTGTYQIEVLDVARSQSLAMGSETDKKAALGASGDMTIRFGSWDYTAPVEGEPATIPTAFTANDDKPSLTISVEAGDSLDSLAKKINATDSGIQASVLSVDGQFQLMLTAPSGEKNALEISVSDLSLESFSFNATKHDTVIETQQGSDASIKVNGLAVTRETNEISDVIEGFNFTLNKASPGDQLTFSVDADKATAQQAVRDFVEGYNSLYETMKNLTGYSRDEENNLIKGDLANDGSAKSIFNQLRSLISTEVTGVESGFTALTNIGIRTERDGTLSIDDEDFNDAFSDNFELVENLFARNTSSTSNYVDVGVGSYSNSTVAGSYAVEITQDPTRGYMTGQAVTQADFDAATDTFTTPLDASSGGYSFKIQVDGIDSDLIELTGTYNNAEELRADLQARINGDEKLKGANVTLDVTFDADNNNFLLTSRDYGRGSQVAFSQASAGMNELGLNTSLTSITGKDVKGTINGEEGFGSGNILLPKLGSDAYGLNLTVREGATAGGAFEMNFSRGFAGTMSKLVNDMLAKDGVIATREENMGNQLDDVSDDRAELERKMTIFEERISMQYLAMQQIIGSLNTTGSALDGILERLPFTAQK